MMDLKGLGIKAGANESRERKGRKGWGDGYPIYRILGGYEHMWISSQLSTSTSTLTVSRSTPAKVATFVV